MKLTTDVLVLIIGLFVILSPGLILTIPGLSQTDITNKGVATDFTSGASGDYCDSANATDDACKRPTKVLTSGFTSVVAVLVHTVVFAAALYFLPAAVGIGALKPQAILALAALFAVLSPGLLLTLPHLSKDDCGALSIGQGTDGSVTQCSAVSGAPDAGGNCEKCQAYWMSGFTSVPAVFVHAIVYGVVAYFVASLKIF